ncbi:hypothetical protein VE26_11415 [Devosia chinhatensis]|uniref:FAD/NAD(P)-binding domain-containing protein n=1 Tax=Devosia chinhatensis TaxID=429727 RepID=A0A0F5FFL0_9HYPH|nr:hypothetical protein VE26_11415 [Devosia chinhatensis]
MCIIGAGALGIALAQHARRLGARVVLVDRGPPEAGDGPQHAMRMAALQASASRAHAVRQAVQFGMAGLDPKVSMKNVQERAAILADELAPLASAEHLAASGIEVVSGAARFADPQTLIVGDRQIRPRAVVIATGADCKVPPVPGLDQIDYFTPETILGNSRKLTHLLVVGGDSDALCLAQAFARLGSQVTLVPQGPILPEHDPEAVAILLSILRQEGVVVEEGANVSQFQPRTQGTGVVVEANNGAPHNLDVSHVLIANGRHVNLDTLSPQAARLRRGPDGHYAVGPHGETGNRRIRVVGAAAGVAPFHTALLHGRAVVELLLAGRTRQSLQFSPLVVMTDPPIAQIGRNLLPARAKARGQRLLRASMAENEQVRAQGAVPGLAKVALAPAGQVLSAAFIGSGASDLASVMAFAMERDIPLAALSRLTVVRPSLLASLVQLADEAADDETVPRWTQRFAHLARKLSFTRR